MHFQLKQWLNKIQICVLVCAALCAHKVLSISNVDHHPLAFSAVAIAEMHAYAAEDAGRPLLLQP